MSPHRTESETRREMPTVANQDLIVARVEAIAGSTDEGDLSSMAHGGRVDPREYLWHNGPMRVMYCGVLKGAQRDDDSNHTDLLAASGDTRA